MARPRTSSDSFGVLDDAAEGSLHALEVAFAQAAELGQQHEAAEGKRSLGADGRVLLVLHEGDEAVDEVGRIGFPESAQRFEADVGVVVLEAAEEDGVEVEVGVVFCQIDELLQDAAAAADVDGGPAAVKLFALGAVESRRGAGAWSW